MQTLPPPEIFVTDAARVFCDGDEPGAIAAILTGPPTGNAAVHAPSGADGHPRVWLQIGSEGSADCGYCDRRFILAGSPADTR